MMNIGNVENKGLELEWSGQLPHNFNYYTSYTYTESKQKSDIVSNGGLPLPTSGKEVPNVPKNLLNVTLGYDDGLYYSSVSGKYVSSFYGDLTNDEKIGGRTVFDLAAGVHLPVDKKIVKSAALRFGISNLFDKEYLTSVRSTTFNAAPYNGVRASTPYYNVGKNVPSAYRWKPPFNYLYPMAFKLQPGGQLAHPQALTLVSNWGERVQVTTLRLER
jgi:iron complex outermembrane recepter protein